MKNRLTGGESTEKRGLYLDKSRKYRFCGYCGKHLFTDLNEFLLHVNFCEVKDNDSNQPALI